jgi:hypothetical protein
MYVNEGMTADQLLICTSVTHNPDQHSNLQPGDCTIVRKDRRQHIYQMNQKIFNFVQCNIMIDTFLYYFIQII